MGEPQNLHFYDLGIFGRVPEPQHHLFLSLETPGYLKQIQKKPLGVFINMFYKSHFVEFEELEILEKSDTENPDDPSNNILKVLDMRSIFIKRHEMEIW